MKKAIISLALSALVGFSASAASGSASLSSRFVRHTTPVTEQELCKPGKWKVTSSKFKSAPVMKEGAGQPDVALQPNENFSYLLLPDGRTWFTSTTIRKEVVSQSEYYTDYNYTGVETKIFDETYQQVGLINFDIPMPEGYEKCSSFQYAPLVSKSFFNTDGYYEIMLTCNFKPTGEPGAHPVTYVFSLRGADTAAEHLTTIDGYYINAINAARDAWSEDFYIIFSGKEEFIEPTEPGEMPLMPQEFHLYTKASYANPTASILHTFTVDQKYIHSDGENELSCPILLSANNGTVYVTCSLYEKTWFEDPFDFTNDNLSADNHYNITLYKVSGWSTKTLEEVGTTSIACDGAKEPYTWRSFCLGTFSGNDDISFDFTTDGKPAYIISMRDSDNRDNSETIFNVYDSEGNIVKTFGSGSTEAIVLLSDVKGQPRQYCFYEPALNGGSFVMTDYPSMEQVAVIPATLHAENTDMLLSLSLDRVAGGSKYRYCIAAANGDNDGPDAIYHPVAWFDHTGTLERIDKIMAGKDAVRIVPYISGATLDRFFFNTNDATEYPALIWRNESHGSAVTRIELSVINDKGDFDLQHVFPAEATGISPSFINTGSTPAIWLYYFDQSDKLYHSEFINLPLNKLQGEGTAENPYLITTAGDFAMMEKNMNAHYRLANDVDFQGQTIPSFNETFMGSFDGAGFTMRNFVVEDKSIFLYVGRNSSATRPAIKDLTLSHVTLRNATAVLAATAMGTDIENVFIYDLKAEADNAFDFGGLVNAARFGTVIKGCGVIGEISAAEANGLGGIVYELAQESKISACSFSGSIKGDQSVGGIAGSIGDTTASISDCHVNAAITASHTVGGIVGDSKRGLISNCVVEGTIAATAPRSEWSDFQNTSVSRANAGGIVGKLNAPQSVETASGMNPGEFNVAVTHNVVAVESITIPEGDEAAAKTVHRIVGLTAENLDPMILDEKYNEETEEWELVFGDPLVETGIIGNHALADLAPVSAEANVDHAEGASVAYEDLTEDFLRGLGLKFNGYSSEEPWILTTNNIPQLHFEAAIGAAMSFDPAQVSVAAGETAAVLLTLENVSIESLTVNSSDEEGCYLNLAELDDDGNVICEVVCVKEGTYTLTATNGRLTATLLVTGLSGIDEIIGEKAGLLTFDGTDVRAEGCTITVYNVSGVEVASGRNTVSASRLTAGVYIATATAADGTRSTLKIIVK